MPKKLYRDVANFGISYSSRMNDRLYRAFFKYPDGTIKSYLSITGIDEMKKTLREIENGRIKVVREKQFNSLEYEIVESRQEEVKRKLREKIEALENDYSYCDEEQMMCVIECPIIQR